ncbi:MAG: purine-binding chemotaxis protein CheW [Clostridiales bacterium]|nr:purine-binding chemotaxis protein CheW [Clostridiales bacterium]
MASSYDELIENGGKIISYQVNDAVYAVDILMVNDIIELPEITKIPLMPKYIRGVINLRGKVVPVIDLKDRFNLENKGYGERGCIVVIVVMEITVGIMVDSVCQVQLVAPDQIKEAPKKNQYVSHIVNVDNSVEFLLDYMQILGL